eukprot:6454892-Amphidinium_carterae.1
MAKSYCLIFGFDRILTKNTSCTYAKARAHGRYGPDEGHSKAHRPRHLTKRGPKGQGAKCESVHIETHGHALEYGQ